MTHVFDAALQFESADSVGGGSLARGNTPLAESADSVGVLRGRTQESWANMVGPFGGITVAAILRAIEEQPDVHGDPVALTVNFLAPVVDGEFDISARAVRTNRSNQHWIVELSQDGDVKTTATAVFGLRRDTWTDIESMPPAVAAPEDVEPQAFPVPIRWTQNYEMRFVDGAVPGLDAEPSESSTTTLWVRDQPPRPLDFAGLAAMCDVFYPRVFLRLGRVMAAGTISMTVYFHSTRDELISHGDDFVLATVHAQRFARGYFDQSGQIWDRRGELLATTHQIVYFKS